MSANLSLELIKCLINQPGVDVNVRGSNGKTPLHYAVEINELSMVALLLNRKNINPLITDDDGKSALFCAREEILQALINYKYGSEEDSLLHLAAMLNEANAVRFLLNKGVNVNEQNALLHTPLHLAAGAGHEEIVEILIREGNADKDVLDARNHAAMHYAVNNKRIGVVKKLVDLDANVNRTGSGENSTKLSPLHNAVSVSNYDERNLCLDIVRCLINAPNSGVNLQDYENKTPLHYAERLKTVEVLLTREDIDPLIKDDNGKTPFCYAKEENKSEIVKALISNRYGVEKNNLLHLAAKKGYEEILGAILKEGVEVDVLKDQGESAVYLAAINRHFNIVKLLLKKRADATDVFEYAITTNNVKLVKLLSKEKDIVLFGKNDNFPTFHLLSNKYFEERKIADKKIKKYTNIICVSITICAIAIVGIYPNIIAAVMVGIVALLENSFKSIYARDEKERTVLHYAVDAKTVRLLVEKGVNVNAADVKGYTALHLAVTEKRLETVRELIKSGAEVNAEEYGNKCIPLHLACMVGEKEIVEELVKAGAEIEQEDECGMTAIDYAKNSKEVTEVLKKETDRIEKLFEQIEPSMRG